MLVPAAAVTKISQVLELDNNNPVALNNLAYYLARETPDEVLRLGQRALELAPENPGIQDTLGWIYYRKGIYGLAAEHLKTAAKRDPTALREFHSRAGVSKNRR
jgi:tetratricopeptide (TPR) repeat protein